MPTSSYILSIFAGFGGLAGISALLNVLLTRRKNKADVAQIEQNISDNILQNINKDNEILRKEKLELKQEVLSLIDLVDNLKKQMQRYEWDQYETRVLIVRLIEWAKRAGDELSRKGSDMEPPPTMELLNKLKRTTEN